MADVEWELEPTWHVGEPFSDGREIENVGCVAVYADEEAAWRLRASARSRDMHERPLSKASLRRSIRGGFAGAACTRHRHYFEDDPHGRCCGCRSARGGTIIVVVPDARTTVVGAGIPRPSRSQRGPAAVPAPSASPISASKSTALDALTAAGSRPHKSDAGLFWGDEAAI
jgi:hypothetical protein